MNKINFLQILTVLLILFSCKSEKNKFDYNYSGEIGKGLKAEVFLNFNGDKVSGKLIYLEGNHRTIELSGILEGELLRLEEFDSEDKLSGIFVGQFNDRSYSGFWRAPRNDVKTPFTFTNKKEFGEGALIEQSKMKMDDVFTKKDLLVKHFSPEIFISSHEARYRKSDEHIEVVFDTIMHYSSNNNNYALVLFRNYNIEADGKREMCHACSGFLSIAKYMQKNNSWQLDNFIESCECGYASWGEVSIPELVEVGNFHFLSKPSGYVGQGYYVESLTIWNTENFKESLSIILGESNEGATPNEKEHFSYESSYKIIEKDSEIILIVDRDGTKLEESSKRIIDFNDREKFVYNKQSKSFNKRE